MLVLLLSFSDTFILMKKKVKKKKSHSLLSADDSSCFMKDWTHLLINLFVMHQFHFASSQGSKFQFDGLEDTRDYLWLYVWVCSQLQSHKFGRQHSNWSSVNFLESLKTLFWVIADKDIITIRWPKMAKPNLIVSIKIILSELCRTSFTDPIPLPTYNQWKFAFMPWSDLFGLDSCSCV